MWILHHDVQYEGAEYLGAFASLEDAVIASERHARREQQWTWRGDLNQLNGTTEGSDSTYEISVDVVQTRVFSTKQRAEVRKRIPARKYTPPPPEPEPRPPRALVIDKDGRAV